jgi:hypothetical protein
MNCIEFLDQRDEKRDKNRQQQQQPIIIFDGDKERDAGGCGGCQVGLHWARPYFRGVYGPLILGILTLSHTAHLEASDTWRGEDSSPYKTVLICI